MQVVTSCNSTRAELVAEFCSPQGAAAVGHWYMPRTAVTSGDGDPAEAVSTTGNREETRRRTVTESSEPNGRVSSVA